MIGLFAGCARAILIAMLLAAGPARAQVPPVTEGPMAAASAARTFGISDGRTPGGLRLVHMHLPGEKEQVSRWPGATGSCSVRREGRHAPPRAGTVAGRRGGRARRRCAGGGTARYRRRPFLQPVPFRDARPDLGAGGRFRGGGAADALGPQRAASAAGDAGTAEALQAQRDPGRARARRHDRAAGAVPVGRRRSSDCGDDRLPARHHHHLRGDRRHRRLAKSRAGEGQPHHRLGGAFAARGGGRAGGQVFGDLPTESREGEPVPFTLPPAKAAPSSSSGRSNSP